MSWPPNREAVVRMRDQILPDLNARLEQPVRLVVAGDGSRALARGKDVEALGIVAEPGDFYDQVDVVVLPRVEAQRSGVSIKLLEAVEAGKLVVAPETLYADCGLSSPWSTELGDVEAITDALHDLYVDAPRDDLSVPGPIEGSDWISLGGLGHMLAAHPAGVTASVQSVEAKLMSSMEELLNRILSGVPTRVQTLNLHHLYLARELPDFRRAVSEADHVTADGWPVRALLRRKLNIDATRVTGADFLDELVGDVRMAGKRVALIGGSEEAAEVLRVRLEAVRSELAIGWHGARREWDPSDLTRQVGAESVDIVIVAVTPPYGELLAADLRRRGAEASIIAVGGALDMLVGQRKRAPEFVQRLGMEWLYRMVQDPKALMRRYLVECIPELARLWVRPRGPFL
jgi:N-acetylglucosaminyldiphosphoundecaprenol N-acetyl-beta-D-mannosaminyltransferase